MIIRVDFGLSEEEASHYMKLGLEAGFFHNPKRKWLEQERKQCIAVGIRSKVYLNGAS